MIYLTKMSKKDESVKSILIRVLIIIYITNNKVSKDYDVMISKVFHRLIQSSQLGL